ncbi:MAG: ATP-binding cassette domain-containing protein [Xanthobacteraceae bacterium]|nr:ATP-binding cassette domain-containing protein [Xanthobacteraceae bacterium]
MRAPDSDLPLQFDRIEYRAGNRSILDIGSLTISNGAPTAVIGPNGAGKTTLLRLGMGLLEPGAGRITWGRRQHAAPVRRAFLFQRPVMLMRSAAGNIDYALASVKTPRGERKRKIAELLALVGLSGFEDRPARRLSGGEQQRLALARSLARDPEILLLDEPTASLDPAAAKSVEDVLRAVANRGVKIVLSTHDLGTARRLAGDVILLHRGRIVEHSASETFFKQPKTEEARRFQAGDLLI